MPAQLKTKQEIEIPTLYARDFAHLERQRGLLQVVYVLIDPRTGERRYVGQTITPILSRLRVHLCSSLSTRSHAASWIRSLLRLGLVPQVEILECVEVDDLDDREIFWIAELKRQGCRLTNSAIGGASGNRGLKQSAETIAKRVAVNKANYWADPERQARMRELSKNSRPPVQLGEANVHAKLTVALVVYVRQQMKMSPPRTTPDLAAELHVSNVAIANAGFGRTWRQVDPLESPAPGRSRRRSADNAIDVQGIKDALAKNDRGCDIAERFGVSRSYVSRVKHGHLHSITVGKPTLLRRF